MKEEKALRARFPGWGKAVIIISISLLGLAVFGLIRFVHWERLLDPRAVRIEPTFREGEERRYKVSRTMTSMTEGMEGMEGMMEGFETSHTDILSLRVARVSEEGVDLVIRKESGTRTIGNRTLPAPGIGKEVRVGLCPRGLFRRSIEGDILEVIWTDLILTKGIPDKELRIGDSWTAPQPVPMPKEIAGMDIELKYTVLGFERIRGYDCVKVKIESLIETKERTVKMPATMPEGINLPEGLTIPDLPEEITMSFYMRTEGVAFLAYQKGFMIIESTTRSKKITKSESITSTMETETTVELL